MTTGLEKLTASEAARQIANGKITAQALTRDCLARIALREKDIGAWAFLDPTAALTQASSADLLPARGSLHGVPIGLKDVIDTAEMPTTYGSPIYEKHQPRCDASVVALLREAGAVILGKTVTTEFAAMTPGKTRNPHDVRRTPGGSSSGSAAAVADFMVPAALGTQTVGSTIRPASYCGAVGFKPTYQFVSMAGVKAQAESLDTIGIFARSVEDLFLLTGVLRGEGKAVHSPALTGPPRFAFCPSPHWAKAEPSTRTAMAEACHKFEAAGASVYQLELSDRFVAALDAQWTILQFEFARALSFERTQRREQLSERLRHLLDGGMKIPVADYAAARALATHCRAEISRSLERFDAIVTPAAAGEAPEGLHSMSDLLFQRLWTLLHLPAITLPGLKGLHDLPIGVQLVGAHGEDGRLLAVARWAETILGSGDPQN